MSDGDNDNLNLRNNVQEELDFDEQHRRKHEEANSKLIESYVSYQSSALKCKNSYKSAFVIVCLIALITPPVFSLIFLFFAISDKAMLESYGAISVIIGDMLSLLLLRNFCLEL